MLEYIYRPLLPYLSVRKIIMFTTCNKFLYSVSESYLKDKCQELYNVEKPKISWRYTLLLLKYGKKDIPLIENRYDGNLLCLVHFTDITIYAHTPNNKIIDPEFLIDDLISYGFDNYEYITSNIQILDDNKKLIDTIDDYIDSFEESDISYRLTPNFFNKVSLPRLNCKRVNHIDNFNNNKYAGLSYRNSDNKTLFEAITSIDFFIKNMWL